MSSIFTLGGRTCQTPTYDLYRTYLEQGLPTDLWWGKANGVKIPAGEDPGIGTLLMLRDDLDRLNLTSNHDLLVDDDTRIGRATFLGLSIIRTECITPGLRGEANGLYVVTVADRRERIRTIPANAAYNLRDCTGDGYLAESLDWGDVSGSGLGSGSCACSGSGGASGSGSTAITDMLWTWQGMVNDLVAKIDGMNELCLPYCPDGYPENFAFWSVGAWKALNIVADRLGCLVTYNPFTDRFAIVECGKADTDLETVLRLYDDRRKFDADPMGLRAPVPRTVRVLFPFADPPGDGTSPWDYIIEDAPQYYPSNSTTDLRSKCWAQSAQYLIGDMGSPALDGQDHIRRARERRDKFYQAWCDSAINPMLRVFTGLVTDSRLMPGRRVKAISIYDRGEGFFTEVYRGNGIMPAGKYQQPTDSDNGCGGGTVALGDCGSGSASGSGCECDALDIEAFFRNRNGECQILPGCIVVVDSSGRVVNLHLEFRPRT